MNKEIKIVTTADGSNTLLLPEFDETYHSMEGAFREAIHVFMLYGLEAWLIRNQGVQPIRIFEVGFGTGLNAWLTLVWAEQNKIPVLYHSIEPFPVEKEIYSQLNYIEIDQTIYHFAPYFKRLHEAPWDEGFIASEYFNMKKEKTSLEDAVLYHADVIFYNPFSMKNQPELWDKHILEKVVETMNPNAVLVSPSAENQLRSDLKALGLEVEILPGPSDKNEMTRARILV